MALAIIRRLTSGYTPVVVLAILLLTSFYLLSSSTGNSERFEDLYVWMLLFNAAALLVLFALIGVNLYRLIRQYRARAAGSRLTVRLVVMFVVLAVIPVSVVYSFSMQYLHQGIDSWFDVRIEAALEDALKLSQVSLDLHKKDLLKQTGAMSSALVDVSDDTVALRLGDLRANSDAAEITLVGQANRIIAFSTADVSKIVPHGPNENIILQLRQGGHFVGLEPIKGSGIHVRVAVPVPAGSTVTETRILQVLYPIDSRLNSLADSVQNYFALYNKLAYLRSQLKNSFTITLSLVLVLSMLAAVWGAFYSARRLMAPVKELAEGTRAVAAGDYNKQLPLAGHDELGFLVRSFNDMTRRIAKASKEARKSKHLVEEQHAYLEAVLGHLSSGVITLDQDLVLRTVNSSVGQILGLDLTGELGESFEKVFSRQPYLKRFLDGVMPHLNSKLPEWTEEIILFGSAGRKILMCRGTVLMVDQGVRGDHVIVFENITELVQAQRDAAWGEVARRLAHEIKNPLTPIQLSAERLRHKFMNKMSDEDAQVIDRSTHTIIQQVEAMKEMVNAFSEYARAPQMQLVNLELNGLVREVMDLYSAADIRLDLDRRAPIIDADSGRIRQLLHNLVKNALDATDENARIDINTRCMDESGCRFVELLVRDYGPGFPDEEAGQYFEPYVTTKPKGTGLGLAIVKKIVEEHGGMVWAENVDKDDMPVSNNVQNEEQGNADSIHGARVIIRMPVVTSDQSSDQQERRSKSRSNE